MRDNQQEERELEDFIEELYYGDDHHEFARVLGRYLFQFVDHLNEQELSPRTKRKYLDNIWYIGYLECNFGYLDEFAPEKVFCSPEPSHEYEFRRKMRSSKYALDNYRATGRKLYKYTKTKTMGYLDGKSESHSQK